MRTLRAFFWGSVLGAILGYVFAPRGSELLRAERDETGTLSQGRSGTARATGGATTSAATTGTQGTAAGSSASWKANAPYIGNSHTKVYHAATDANLPDEENRVYFDTREEAEALGYRPAAQFTGAR